LHDTPVAINRHYLCFRPGGDPLGIDEVAGIAHLAVGRAEKGVAVIEHASYEIWVAAGSHGHLRRLLDDGNLRSRVQSFRAGRGLWPGGRTANDDDLLAHD